MRKHIYEYRVIGHINKGSTKNPDWDSEIIDEGEILASDLKEAEFYIHREIDESDIEGYGLKNIEIVIRPFVNNNRVTWPAVGNSSSTFIYDTQGTTAVNDSINLTRRTTTI
jgi:hypothetical protein